MDAAVILSHIQKILQKEEASQINESTKELVSLLNNTLSSKEDIFNSPDQNFKYVLDDLTQIIYVQTTERKKYYLKRLIKAITEVRTTDINDINLNRWKEYDDIKTDSLWIISKRDRTGSHSGKYWGNFIPQIPNQLLRRYTKKGDWVLDPFSGSGTTLIECKRLGRNALGIDISPDAVKEAEEKIHREKNNSNTVVDLFNSDSLKFNYEEYTCSRGIKQFQFVILHPPYWDIIKFTEDEGDLSNCKSPENFLKLISEMTRNVASYLEEGRYLALVIGDKYNKGEWIPLGFYSMQEIINCGLKLKSVIVKNFDETRGKMQQKELWRYRALAGGFYIFKHEYIFLFQKTKSRKPKEEECSD